MLAVDVVRLDLEVLLFILAVLMRSPGCRSTEYAFISRTSIERSNELSILSVEWVHTGPMRLVEGKVIMLGNAFLLGLNFLLALELNSLDWSNSTRRAALISVLVVATWLAETSSESR